MIKNFKPHVFSDTAESDHRKGMDGFVEETGIRSGMAVPLYQNQRMIGVILIYCLEPRKWSGHETELMAQIGESLAVAIGHRENQNKLVTQEQFLENVFKGMDIGIFVLAIRDKGLVLFERVNHTYESLRRFTRGRIAGTSLDSLSQLMDSKALGAFKRRIDQCIREKKTVKFLEETRDGMGKVLAYQIEPGTG